jgi:S1-C subfamily serine protease
MTSELPPPPPPPFQPPVEPHPVQPDQPEQPASRRWRWVVGGATAGAVLGVSAAIPLTLAARDSEPYSNAQQQRTGTDDDERSEQAPWFGDRSSLVPSDLDDTAADSSEEAGVVLIDTALPGGEGAGTGLVLSDDGLVLTNYHVVDGSTEVQATIASSGDTYTGRVLGYDAEADVALVQLDNASGLETARLDDDGDDDEVGDPVTAVGNARGQGSLSTVEGTIKADDQSITTSPPDAESLTGLLETDAAAVPGYSGGPMLDDEGEVIGVTTAASADGAGESYGVPIDTALDVVDQIEAGDEGDGVHIGAPAYLGITVTEDGQSGSAVKVAGVADGTPAADAGLVAGDLITAVDGTRVTNVEELLAALDAHDPGDTVDLTWTHDGKGQSGSITLEESPYA